MVDGVPDALPVGRSALDERRLAYEESEGSVYLQSLNELGRAGRLHRLRTMMSRRLLLSVSAGKSRQLRGPVLAAQQRRWATL